MRKLQWRNSELGFGSVGRLVAALEARTEDDWLTRTRDSDDLLALKSLAGEADVTDRIRSPRDVKLLLAPYVRGPG